MDNIIMSFLENNRNIVGDFHFCNSETYSTPNVRPNVPVRTVVHRADI